MPEEASSKKRKHFVLRSTARAEVYKWPPIRIDSEKTAAPPDRHSHGRHLQTQIQALEPEFATARRLQEEAGLETGFGIRIAFESFPGIELALESLASERSGIELLNVTEADGRSIATVFVPDGKLAIFENKIAAYLDESKDTQSGKPRNARLLNTIAEIRAATLRELWTDDAEVYPQSDTEAFWWEVWLPVRDDRQRVIEQFSGLAKRQGFELGLDILEFPERSVLLVYGPKGQMTASVMTLNSIAELRRAKQTQFFVDLHADEEREWSDDLLRRVSAAADLESQPCVCLLDTGLNRGHPLLAPFVASADLHTVEPGWGTNDTQGHGTEMAGLALFGDLEPLLTSNEPLVLNHGLESVKLLNRNHGNRGNGRLHGELTTQAVVRPEISKPHRPRVFSMAITADDYRDRGQPSAWSAAVDRLAFGADEPGAVRRLFVLSAGNVNDNVVWANYPDSNVTDGIHDPGQSWNALTVGAMTHLDQITESGTQGYRPVAPAGGLSPFSTTSVTWQDHWPLKPDVVFEGGNICLDPAGDARNMTSLRLLTTHANPERHLFTTTNATSAAATQVARMAAQLMADYPNLWPESIRGLIVHSARWTDAMRQMVLPVKGNPNKGDMAELVRHCGFGEPDLERAQWSMANSLTLVCEGQLRPFLLRRGGSQPVYQDMNLHRLPWPLSELQGLGEMPVEMRVTLSYFIEPSPSKRGPKSRYRYESHGLRFDAKRPVESEEQFRERVNAAARNEEEDAQSASSNDQGWLIGPNNRHRGSIHSDIWRGTAAELANRGVLAVYPTSGWWKTRPARKRYDRPVRYTLLVSIHAPEAEIDLYNAVANQIDALTLTRI